MKSSYLLFIFASLSMSSCWAADKLVKTCDYTVPALGQDANSVSQIISIFERPGKSMYATVGHRGASKEKISTEKVAFSEHAIRPNISGNLPRETLNKGEQIIVHSMDVVNDPIFEGLLHPGFDLQHVRSVKLYEFESAGPESADLKLSDVIVEAKNSSGIVIGSFLSSGLMLGKCR